MMAGNFASAAALVAGVTPTNAVETNYVSFYNLYVNYASNRFEHTNNSDLTDLEALASGCPGVDGACVHQARALYNSVYRAAEIWSTCGGSGARAALASKTAGLQYNIQVYPNPAQNVAFLTGLPENSNATVEILDYSGKTVAVKTVKVAGKITKLDLDLINGLYLIKIMYNSNVQTVKKLLIVR